MHYKILSHGELNGGAGNDFLNGGIGTDLMDGGLGNDNYIVEDEFDAVVEHAESGIDTVEQYIDRPFYNSDEFGNLINSGSYHLLFDNVENLILKGEAKKAFGNHLDNTITLNRQDNFVNALSGNDTIIYQKGGGKDTILSIDSMESKDSLVVKGYDLSEAMFVRVDNTLSPHDMLQIRFKGSNDQITFLDYFANQKDGQDNRIDEITFKKSDNVTNLSQSEFEKKIFTQANNHAPQVNKYPKPIKAEIGKALSVTFDKDTIKDIDTYDSELSYYLTLTNKGADGQYAPLPSWLNFNPATLTLTGTPPQGTTGNLQFILWGKDSFSYSAGVYLSLAITNNDKPLESTPSTPVVASNTIKDTKGNDILKGGTTDNTFVYTAGKDTLIDKGGNDTLIFGNGVTFNQVGRGLIMSGNDLVLRVNGSNANQITLKDFFSNADSIIETIKFETGGQIDYKQIYELFGKEIPVGSSKSTLTPTTKPNPDTDSDTSLTISHENNIVGDNYTNKLYGTNGHDQLQGLAGTDTLDGKSGHDILIGGSGNDTLIGGTGNDLYYFTKGFGKDTIINTGGGYDNVYFDGIGFNQVSRGLIKKNNDLILKVSGSADELTIKDLFAGGESADININFADGGGSISSSQLLGLFKSNKTAAHTDINKFNKALEVSLALMEEFKTLNADGSTTII